MAEEPGFIQVAADRVGEQLDRAADGALAGAQAVPRGIRDGLAVTGIEVSETSAAVLASGFVVLVAFGFVRLLARSAQPGAGAPDNALGALTRGPRRFGLAAVLVFFAVLGGWSVSAPLASAALAPGVVSPDGSRKTVQHLEGGIIRSIHVREGDRIQAGETLITLDDIRARALHSEIRERMVHVLANEARLEAERAGTPEIAFPPALTARASADLEAVMEGQRQLFSSRHATQEGRRQILEARVRQIEEQNAGLVEVIDAQDRQIALIDEEIEASQSLLDKGLERKPRVLALRRARADIAAEKAANRARIAENEQAMGETRLQLLTIAEEREERIDGELADVRRMLAELRGQLPSREDILERTVIRAPIDGTVMNVRPTTEAGVVGPGETLLDIVPDNVALIIDARVKPTDIERIRPGMSARVVLTAYRQRTLPLINGILRSVSADALTDERTGEPFFLAKVEVLPEDLARLEEVQLSPGMPAEVMLLDGEQSLVEYLLAPILDSARRSFREG